MLMMGEIFTIGNTYCESTSMIEFTLEKLKAYIVPSAILLLTDFTTYNFWSMLQKLAVLRRIFWKVYGVPEF